MTRFATTLICLGLTAALPGAATACATASSGAKCASVMGSTAIHHRSTGKWLSVRPPEDLQTASAPREIETLSTRTGGKWLNVAPAAPPVEVGDTLPKEYMVLTNTRYFGLPPVGDNWKYYRVERDIYRVENGTRTVLERVTNWANARFP